MSLEEIFKLDVLPGMVAITWFNSYSGVIVKTPGATLIFDPVKANLGECVQADAIVITHEHLDHFDPKLTQELQQRTEAPILTTPFVAASLLSENVKALKTGDCYLIKDIELHALHCKHPANEPLSFIISTQSGINIYHPSDSEVFAGMIEVAARHRPDILLCVGASMRNAAQIAGLVHPNVAISLYTDAGAERRFSEAMEKESPETKARLIKRLEIYQYPEVWN